MFGRRSTDLVVPGNHNSAAACGEPSKKIVDEMSRVLLGDKPLPRNRYGGHTHHAIRYEKRTTVKDLLTIAHARYENSEGVQSVAQFAEMFRSYVYAIGAQKYPLDLVCQRELTLREQRKTLPLDEVQFALQANPTVPLCLEALRCAAEYRTALTAFEIWNHQFLAARGGK